MGLVENNHVVEEFAAQGPNHSFHERILPRTSRCDPDFFDPAVGQEGSEAAPVDGIVVADQVTGRRIEGKSFADLLLDPDRAGVGRDPEVDDLAALVTKDDEVVQDSEGESGYGQKVDGRQSPDVVVQERAPGW